MNKFEVEIDLTYSVSVCVEADNEEEARRIAEDKIGRDPLYYASKGAIANISPYNIYEEAAE